MKCKQKRNGSYGEKPSQPPVGAVCLLGSAANTLLLFLLPAGFVAYETVEMVNTVVLTLLVLAAVLLLLMVLAVAAMLRRRSSARMVLQEQADLRRQEELNERLEESNAMLARSKEAAEQALQIA